MNGLLVTANRQPELAGVFSTYALAAMERISKATLPPGYSYEWTGTALQEKTAGGHAATVLGLAVLFADQFLVALYKSWNIPIPALLSVSVGILGAVIAIFVAGLSFDVYAQIGLVVLVALAAKEIIGKRVDQRAAITNHRKQHNACNSARPSRFRRAAHTPAVLYAYSVLIRD